MRTRASWFMWIIAAAVPLANAALTAQRAAPARPVEVGAVRRAEQEIDKAATARGINLTEAAKQTLAQEAIHQEATTPTRDTGPVTGALSDTKLSILLMPLADVSKDQKLDVVDVETRIVDNKTKQVVATLPADIKAHERVSGKVVPAEVRLTLTKDLTSQSDALSKSGLAVDAIRHRNEQTLKAIDLAIGTGPITAQSYQMARAAIFTKNVLLSILSTPEGASVSIEGTPIGRTNITDKQVKPSTYQFRFQLAGYADAKRAYYVAPGLESDSVVQMLTPISTAGAIPTARPPTERDFPVGYIILGAIIVMLLAALVARRR